MSHKIKDLEDLLIHELRDLHNAEKQLVKALPKVARAATDPDLKSAIESHLEETKGHVDRLEKVLGELGAPTRGGKCEAMEGLIEEASGLMEEEIEPQTLDAALIAAANRVEHYEIAGYGCAVAFAKQLGHDGVASTLHKTLEEEKEADRKLVKLAEKKINAHAEAGAAG